MEINLNSLTAPNHLNMHGKSPWVSVWVQNLQTNPIEVTLMSQSNLATINSEPFQPIQNKTSINVYILKTIARVFPKTFHPPQVIYPGHQFKQIATL